MAEREGLTSTALILPTTLANLCSYCQRYQSLATERSCILPISLENFGSNGSHHLDIDAADPAHGCQWLTERRPSASSCPRAFDENVVRSAARVMKYAFLSSPPRTSSLLPRSVQICCARDAGSVRDQGRRDSIFCGNVRDRHTVIQIVEE
jgi:hypothetical protein